MSRSREVWLNWDHFRPDVAGIGEFRAKVNQVWPRTSDLGERNRQHQVWPNSAEFLPVSSADLVECGPKSAEVGPTLLHSGLGVVNPNLADSGPKFGQSFSDVNPNLADPAPKSANFGRSCPSSGQNCHVFKSRRKAAPGAGNHPNSTKLAVLGRRCGPNCGPEFGQLWLRFHHTFAQVELWPKLAQIGQNA